MPVAFLLLKSIGYFGVKQSNSKEQPSQGIVESLRAGDLFTLDYRGVSVSLGHSVSSTNLRVRFCCHRIGKHPVRFGRILGVFTTGTAACISSASAIVCLLSDSCVMPIWHHETKTKTAVVLGGTVFPFGHLPS